MTYPIMSSPPDSKVNRIRLRYWAAREFLKLANMGLGCKRTAMANLNRARSAMQRLVRPVERYTVDADITIAGIPAGVHLVSYQRARPMVLTGSGYGDALPPDLPDMDYIITDRSGYRADWLARKVSEVELDKLVKEALKNGR